VESTTDAGIGKIFPFLSLLSIVFISSIDAWHVFFSFTVGNNRMPGIFA